MFSPVKSCKTLSVTWRQFCYDSDNNTHTPTCQSSIVGVVEWLKLFIKKSLVLYKTNGLDDFMKAEFALVANTLNTSGLLAL